MAQVNYRYYVLTLGGEVGPMDDDGLREALGEQRVQLTDQVRTSTGQRLGTVAQVLGSTVRSPAGGFARTTQHVPVPPTEELIPPAPGSDRMRTGSDRVKPVSDRVRPPSDGLRAADAAAPGSSSGGRRARRAPPARRIPPLAIAVTIIASLVGAVAAALWWSAPQNATAPATLQSTLPVAGAASPAAVSPTPPPVTTVTPPALGTVAVLAPGRPLGRGLVVQDTFDQVGPLNTWSGGHGWMGGWMPTQTVAISNERLMPQAQGGTLDLVIASDAGWPPVRRTLATPLTSGTWWISCRMDVTQRDKGWCYLGLAAPGNIGNQFAIGSDQPFGFNWWAQRQTPADGTALGRAVVPATTQGPALLVVFLELQSDRSAFTCWVNPPEGTEPGSDRVGGAADLPPMAVEGIELIGTPGCRIRLADFRIGTSYTAVRQPLP